MSSKRLLTFFGSLTLAAAVALVIAGRLRTEPSAPPTAQPPAAAEPAALRDPLAGGERATHAPLTMAQLFAEGRAKISDPSAKPSADDAAAPPSPARPTQQEQGPSPLDRELEATLSADPVLRRFHNLRKKALRSKAEQAEYQALLADEALIDEAKTELSESYAASSLDQSDELRRLQRVQFLNAALAWAENPARAAALASIESLLLADIPTTVPKEVRGSLLGDKFDLYQHLLLADPARAKALLALASGTSSEKILELAHRTGVTSN